MTPPRPNSFQSNNNPKHFPTYPEKILKVKIKADLKVGLTLTKGKIALHHFLSLCTSGHHCVISVFVLTHTLCKCSSPVLRDMCGDSSSQIQACTCCLFLISTAFPTNSVMADRLINIKVTAPGWSNRSPLNSRQLSNAEQQWCHLMPSEHVTAHLD